MSNGRLHKLPEFPISVATCKSSFARINRRSLSIDDNQRLSFSPESPLYVRFHVFGVFFSRIPLLITED